MTIIIPGLSHEPESEDRRPRIFLDILKLDPLPEPEPDYPIAYFHGRIGDEATDGYYIIRTRPGEAPDGTCAVDELAKCATFEAAMAAGSLMSGVALMTDEERARFRKGLRAIYGETGE